jgi:hypothetical protein
MYINKEEILIQICSDPQYLKLLITLNEKGSLDINTIRLALNKNNVNHIWETAKELFLRIDLAKKQTFGKTNTRCITAHPQLKHLITLLKNLQRKNYKCLECNGTGVFKPPFTKSKCYHCNGTGRIQPHTHT